VSVAIAPCLPRHGPRIASPPHACEIGEPQAKSPESGSSRAGTLWHRIDLGAAVTSITSPITKKPAYKPPPDPYAWPDTRDSGQSYRRSQPRQRMQNGGGQAHRGAGSGGGSSGEHETPPLNHEQRARSAEQAEAIEKAPLPAVAGGDRRRRVRRGTIPRAKGRGLPTSDFICCTVDVVMTSHNCNGDRHPGSYLDRRAGRRFKFGAVIIPAAALLGDYDLRSSPRSWRQPRCSGAQSVSGRSRGCLPAARGER
jgi:hypothetical protein